LYQNQSSLPPSTADGGRDSDKAEIFLLQTFEADRQAGRPHEFCRAFFGFSFFLNAGSFLFSMSRKRISTESLFLRMVLALAIPTLIPGVAAPAPAAQTLWKAIGPDGGDARTFAAVPGHPDHLYLGR
jgi:hypothetical protein